MRFSDLSASFRMKETQRRHVVAGPVDGNLSRSRYQFSSVAQLCLTLCDPMDCSTSGLPVHHQLLESAQTPVHQVLSGSEVNNPLANVRDLGLIDPWAGKIPRRRKWQSAPVFLPEESHGQSLGGYSPWGRKGVRHNLVTKEQ